MVHTDRKRCLCLYKTGNIVELPFEEELTGETVIQRVQTPEGHILMVQMDKTFHLYRLEEKDYETPEFPLQKLQSFTIKEPVGRVHMSYTNDFDEGFLFFDDTKALQYTFKDKSVKTLPNVNLRGVLILDKQHLYGLSDKPKG